ncbi:MAG: hypothetical protein FJZ01_25870 [Candidatus Sericytochromatia bacterium]|nr:hypothetical protein [Candidatus Tanganyikabacteria bacterium]
MRRPILLSPFAAILAGCGLLPGLLQARPCTVDKVVPAQIFAVTAPARATAGQPFKVTAWIRLPEGGGGVSHRVTADAVKITPEADGKTLTVTGKIDRTEPAPGSNCAFPAIYQPVQAWKTETGATLQAGTYQIRIAPESFTGDRPEIVAGEPYGSGVQAPSPQASTSITVE